MTKPRKKKPKISRAPAREKPRERLPYGAKKIPLGIEIDSWLRDELEDLAQNENERSLTREIVWMIKRRLEEFKRWPPEAE